MIRTACAALAVILAAASARPQDFSPEELANRASQRRAVDAVIGGMPTVNYDLMLQQVRKIGGETNQIVYWSGLPDWKNQTLTPTRIRSIDGSWTFPELQPVQ